MDLDKMFEVFASWQTMFLCLSVFLLVFGIRRIVETAAPVVKTNKWWNEVSLPLLPLIVGMVMGLLAKSFPWPVVIGTSLWARGMYGAICGLASGWVYTRFRSIMKNWNQGSDSGSTNTPPVTSLAPKPTDTPPEPPIQ